MIERLTGRRVLLERRDSLDPEPSSAGAARRLLRDALRAAGKPDWIEAGELAVSEIVTNAALHAHTTIDLRIGVYPDEVCVEVRDHNPVLPVPRHYDDEATTGRGMGLVAALASACGVESLGADGKVVWFCVGEGGSAPSADVDAGALLDAWAAFDLDPAPDGTGASETATVVLRSMPSTLWLSARQHHDAILRELVLYLAEHAGIDADIASGDGARSLISSSLVRALDERRAAMLPAAPPRWEADELDLTLHVRPDVAPCFAILQDVLDLAESLAVAGELFTRPALPEIVAVRDWACEQAIAQLAGAPPSPWPGTAREQFETTVRDRADAAEPDWNPSTVTDASVPVVAADDANRIIAASRTLAELVGWEIDDLVGRRIVTLVPPRFRDAHVAGFTRHLSTGEAHVLGRSVEVPVLRRDGTEIACRLLINRAPATTGRAVYIAQLEPLESHPG